MSFNLHQRHLLSLVHHDERELRYLLDLSRDLKRAKYAGTEVQHTKVLMLLILTPLRHKLAIKKA